MLIGTVTDFTARGKGYQLHAGKMLRKRLAREGVNHGFLVGDFPTKTNIGELDK